MFDYVLLIVGGLLLFLYGINLISSSLTKLAKTKINKLINFATKSDLRALLVGILITLLFHSSSAISVILIAFIASKILSLHSACFIMIGANIGSTATAFIVSLDLSKFYMLFIIIGCFLLLIERKDNLKYLGYFFFGLGIFFMGLVFMTNSVTYIINNKFDYLFVLNNTSNFKNLFFSIGITSAIQSSSAMIKIVQELYSKDLFTLSTSILFVMGANIGTCVTGLLASIKTSKTAKKLALFNLMFNIIGTIFIFILLSKYIFFVSLFEESLCLDKETTITLFHFIFNLSSSILIIPFIYKKKVINKKCL